MNVFIRIKKLSYQSKYWLGCRYFEETNRDKMLVNVFQDLADMTMLCLRFCQFIHFFFPLFLISFSHLGLQHFSDILAPCHPFKADAVGRLQTRKGHERDSQSVCCVQLGLFCSVGRKRGERGGFLLPPRKQRKMCQILVGRWWFNPSLREASQLRMLVALDQIAAQEIQNQLKVCFIQLMVLLLILLLK